MLEIPDLKTTGEMQPHLHRYLKLRLGIYLAVAGLSLAFVIYNAFTNSISGLYPFLGVIFGILIGYLFSRTHKVAWDKGAAKVIAKVDTFGIFVIILYTLFEVFRNKIVANFVTEGYVTVTSFSVLAGLMYGRVLGFRGNILKILRERDLV